MTASLEMNRPRECMTDDSEKLRSEGRNRRSTMGPRPFWGISAKSFGMIGVPDGIRAGNNLPDASNSKRLQFN
jgi:hypothetical protein